ncbi:MAG: L,D-transpeptidase family protein, partial [Byssovorax sp.]
TRRPILLAALLALPVFLSPTGAFSSSRAGATRRPSVDEILIDKSDHRLELRARGSVVQTYRVAIGSGGSGPKRMEGDKVTPVGTYRVTGRIKGLFHNFLVVSYPNDEDRALDAELKRRGEVPDGHGVGNGIGIHGTGDKDWNGVHKEHDWTFGCVALDDDEIDEIAALVKDGTRIVISD